MLNKLTQSQIQFLKYEFNIRDLKELAYIDPDMVDGETYLAHSYWHRGYQLLIVLADDINFAERLLQGLGALDEAELVCFYKGLACYQGVGEVIKVRINH